MPGSYRAVGNWSSPTSVTALTVSKVSGTRAVGSAGYRLRNNGSNSVYIVEVRAGDSAPTSTSITSDNRFVYLLPGGQAYEGGLTEGDVYCLSQSGTNNVIFQEVLA